MKKKNDNSFAWNETIQKLYNSDEQANQRSNYELVRHILKNGDVCEMKTWDGKIVFGIYMDDYLYKKQDDGLVVGMGGFEPQVTAIRRPQCIRCAFQCFIDGDTYNYDYRKYGAFDTVFEAKE